MEADLTQELTKPGITNVALEKELNDYVTRPEEHARLRGIFEQAAPLMQDIAQTLIVGNQHAVSQMTRQALDEQYAPNRILDDGLIAGMSLVGIKFRDGVIFVPEVLIAARAMKAGMAHLEPILSAAGIEPLGTVIMGTVKGDLHDIGKNLCIMMLRGAGFTVHDLGVDTKAEKFMDAVQTHNAPIVGMSALLTTTMPNMGRTIKAFEDAGLRESVKFMVGGAPVTQEFADEMGADGYGKDAIACVELAKKLVAEVEAVVG
jgi:5-methyltetrahydrofolate--homocysteine methyltransferase